MYKKKVTNQSTDFLVTFFFEYWVGESNSYCEIENLEY